MKWIELESSLLGQSGEHGTRARLRWNVESSDVVSSPVDVERREQRVNSIAAREQALDRGESIVLRVTQRVAGGGGSNPCGPSRSINRISRSRSDMRGIVIA